MPVLFNKESGLAENLPDQAAQAALQDQTHEVPLVDPNGDMGSATHDQAPALLSQGYRQPSPQELTGLLSKAKYSTPGQQTIGALEQVAKGVAGPLATAAEVGLGVPAEDIRGREEAKGAGEKMLEQGLGLVGSAFIPGGGQAHVLEMAGEVGAHALGIGEAATTMGKIGSAAARAAVENAVYQSGDEVSKRLLSDPNQTAQTALANIGLAGVIGGGFGATLGAIPPIWSATLGPKAENFLRSISSRANGETLPLSEDLTTVLSNMEKSGKVIPPEIRAGLSENPIAHEYFNELRESGTTTGDALRETISKFQGDVSEQLKNVFQKEGPVTSFEAGEKLKSDLQSTADQLNDRVNANYDNINVDRNMIKTSDNSRLKSWNSLMEKAQNDFGTDSPQYALFKNYGDRMLARDSIGQLDILRTDLFNDMKAAKNFVNPDFNKARALGEIYDHIGNFQDSQIGQAGKDLFIRQGRSEVEAEMMANGLVKSTKVARDAYKEFLGKMSDVASVGKLGKIGSYGSFTEALEKVPSAKLADKIFDPKNIEGLRYMADEHPAAFQSLAQAKKTAMIEAATTKGDLMHNQLLNAVNKLPREVRDLMFSKEEMNTINASGKILRESVKRPNPSGTVMTFDKVMQNLPAGVAALASMLTGHNPVLGFMLGHAAKFIGRDAPDAAKASLLKFLGSPEAIDGSAWKTMADYFHAAQRGEAMLTKSAKGVIKAGQEVLPQSQIPNSKSREKLDKKLLQYQQDPTAMLDIGGKLGHYAPDHAAAMGHVVASTVNYLNGLRPAKIQNSPLDEPFEQPFQQDRFEGALDVAEQPMIVFQHLKDGTLLPEHLQDLKTMYPSLYANMSSKLMEEMVSHVSKEGEIPYRTQIGLSMFLGQPLESSMTQPTLAAIQMAQNRSIANQSAQEAQQSQAPKGKSLKSLNKMSEGYATASQAREGQRQSSKV